MRSLRDERYLDHTGVGPCGKTVTRQHIHTCDLIMTAYWNQFLFFVLFFCLSSFITVVSVHFSRCDLWLLCVCCFASLPVCFFVVLLMLLFPHTFFSLPLSFSLSLSFTYSPSFLSPLPPVYPPPLAGVCAPLFCLTLILWCFFICLVLIFM